MRMTQFIGHTNESLSFIENLKVKETTDEITGMFDEPIHTCRVFEDSNGELWEEFEQFTPWSSGPMIFLGLKNKNSGDVIGWKRVDRSIGEYVDWENGEFYA